MFQIFCSPARYTQGKNATRVLGRELTGLGLVGPALIVASKSPIAELSDAWTQTLGEAGIAFKVHTFAGESSVAEVGRVVAAAKKLKARLIIGAGGGKVLDTGRAAAAELDLPVVNCPTVVATDAPTSALSVIYTDAGVFDSYRFYKRNPDLVLVDTQVIAHSPPRLFVAGMGDALSTWFEAKSCSDARKNHSRGGQTTLAALALARLCYDTIVADGYDALCAVRQRAVTPAKERVTEANTLLSGLGFESSGLAAAHSVHNGLTAADGTHDYYHGEKVAFGTLTQLVLEGQSGATIEQVLGFCVRVGLPVTLKQIGIEDASDELLRDVAARATLPGETIHNEPFVVKSDMVADAIRTADALGRAFLSRCDGAD